MSWEAIDHAIDAGDHATALAGALERWRRLPWAILAEVIDALAARVEPDPLRAGGDLQQAWLQRAAQRRPEDLGLLLELLPRKIPFPEQARWWRPGFIDQRYPPLHARIAALAGWPDDPRLAGPLVDLVVRVPWPGVTADGFRSVYDPIMELIARTADERLAPRLRHLAAHPTGKNATARAYLMEALGGAAAEVEARLQARPPLPEDDAARAGAVLDRLGGRGARPPLAKVDLPALYAAVLADPDDDAARAVWADALLEHADPRGEFVALQFKDDRGEATDADRKRIRGLQQRHGKSWLGERLAAVLVNCVFRKGLLDEAELAQNSAAEPAVWAVAPHDPALATVRVLRQGRGNETHYRAFVGSAVMRSLREIRIASRNMLREITSSARPFTRLELARPPLAQDLRALGQLPELRELMFRGRAGGDALTRTFAGQTLLERLEVVEYAPSDALAQARLSAEWFAAVRVLAPLPRVRVFMLGEATRLGDGISLDLRGGWYVTEVLDALPCRVVRLRVTAAEVLPLRMIEPLRAAIRRHAPDEVELPGHWDV